MGGFFGTIQHKRCVEELFYGIDYQSHLGTKRGGMATYSIETGGFKRSIHNLQNTYFRTRFEEDLPKFFGEKGIGVISDTDAQPLLMNSHLGRFAIVTVGKVNNMEEIADELLTSGNVLTEFSSGRINPTELVGQLIIKGKTFVEGIEHVYKTVKGSCSMLILTDTEIIAARDFWGRTPIIIGKKEGAMAATSESSAFPNLGYEIEYFVGPGEIVRLTADGMEVLRKAEENMQICSFLWIYYGFPTSIYEGKNVEEMRYNCGANLAKRDGMTRDDIDIVAGVPDSGIAHAIGYANESHVPYSRPFIKYTPTWPRSFMPTVQSRRDMIARMKLIPVHELIDGKRILLIDDSIVRGTQLRETCDFLYNDGAKEVHARPACPPIMFGCKYISFSRSTSDMELIARRIISREEGEDVSREIIDEYTNPDSDRYKNMVEGICRQMNFTSLNYNRLDDMLDAVGIDKDKLCTYCWNGKE